MKNLVKLNVKKLIISTMEGIINKILIIDNEKNVIMFDYSCIENNVHTYCSIEVNNNDLKVNKDIYDLKIPVEVVNNYQKYNWYYDVENNNIVVNAKTKNLLNCSNTNITIDNLKNYAKDDIRLAKMLYENNIEIINYKSNINLINIDYKKTAKIDIEGEIISIVDFIVENNIDILYFPCDRLPCFLLYKWIIFEYKNLIDDLIFIFENI